MGASSPVEISIGPRQPTGGQPLRVSVGDDRVIDLWFSNAGLACCAVEVHAALARLATMADGGQPVTNVLVVSGTVTDKLAPTILSLYDALPEPRRVLSFGSCANCGGPYWDSYCVTKGIDQLIPVDVYVPGCPPRPEALLDGLRSLAERA